ncbi:LysM domain/BON superfamily protein [compost metagenome]
MPHRSSTDANTLDIDAELAMLRRAVAAPRDTVDGRTARIALLSATLIPTVIGAITVGATADERPTAQDPQPPAMPGEAAPARDAHLIAPIHRTHVLPLTPEHKPLPPRALAPDFSFHPRFKTMVSTQRGMAVTTGRTQAATLYQVAPGDSLYAIAKALLGSGARWRELYAANRDKLGQPSLIRVGMTLTVPQTRGRPAAASHQVAVGDSLYTIAAKRLHDPLRWREIAALNKARLRGGTTIYPHQVLLLPSV